MEILVALCIVLISLVPLIHLHVVSIRMAASSSHMARATLLANSQLAEILARKMPELGKSSGRVEDETGGIVYRWTSVVTDTPVPTLESVRLMGIRQVHVEVTWQDGERGEVVSLDTLVHITAQSKREVLNGSNENKNDNKTMLPETRL